jgi:hypothetical protein
MEFQRKIRLIEERLVELKNSRPATAESPAIKVRCMRNLLNAAISDRKNAQLQVHTAKNIVSELTVASIKPENDQV